MTPTTTPSSVSWTLPTPMSSEAVTVTVPSEAGVAIVTDGGDVSGQLAKLPARAALNPLDQRQKLRHPDLAARAVADEK